MGKQREKGKRMKRNSYLAPGPAQRNRGAVLAIALLFLAALVGLTMTRADAAGGPEFLVQFGETGNGAGNTTNPRGVATDPDNGHVFVAELFNRRISEFTAWGEFVKAWGWDVAGTADPGDTAPTNEFEICTVVCKGGVLANVNSAPAGKLSSSHGVAVDSAGDIYVVDQVVRRVQKFNADGEFVLMFGGGVNKTKVEDPSATPAERNVCTAASGDVCQAGTTGNAEGEFGAWVIGSFIGVGPADTVYVGDANRIQRFNPDGSVKAPPIDLAGSGFVESLAVDPSGDLFVASQSVSGIRRVRTDGAVLNTFCTDCVPTGLATDSLGNVWVVDGVTNPTIRKFSSGGVELASFGQGEFTGSTGIATNGIGDVYVSNFTNNDSYVRAYGPLPYEYGDPPAAPPTIASPHVTSVGTTAAVVKAEVNPHFWPTTHYVEYGTADCSVAVCAQQPAAPGTPLSTERERDVPTGDVALRGLAPGTVYHYRFVATSESGTVVGPDREFKTFLPGAFSLPDGRAFEMVSPVTGKNSAELGKPGGTSGLVDAGFSVKPLQASVSGGAIAYPSFTAFGDAESAPAASTYLSRRGSAGWSTANISPPNEQGFTRDPFRGFSADLSFAAVVQKEPKLDPAAVEDFENLYLRDNRDGSVRALTTETPQAPGIYCVSFAGASESFDRVFFVATGAARPDSPEATYPAVNLYEWSAGQLSLVSVLPDGTPAPPAHLSGFGAGGDDCKMNEVIVHNAISADGSRIFWTRGGNELFARLDGTETIQLDAAKGGPGLGGGGQFWAASDDGSKVFFTSPNRLTADASAPGSGSLGDLYLYDFDAESGKELRDLSADPTPGSDPPAVRGVLGASEDGTYVYFVANGALAGDAAPGQPNLYLWRAGEGLRFIATLSTADGNIGNDTGLVRFSGVEEGFSSWALSPSRQMARVTPDGRHLAFVSAASLTGYDNLDQSSGEPASQVYLYSADGDTLVCPSCNPSGVRPIGFSELPVWITPYEQPRYLADDGGRLFFLSFDALALNDTNGRQDVYEFEREGLGTCSAESPTYDQASGGCLFLISTGRSSDDSFFLDASADGRDVFVSSREQLAPADEDERYDIYDARVGGGFPPPPPPPAICLGEACRPAQAAPRIASPASSGFAGEGNLRPRRLPACGRRQLLRGNRCIAKRKLAQRICRRKQGVAKRRCIRNQTRRLNRVQRRQRRRAGAIRGAAR
jgi:hypothetical protein